MQSYFAVVEQKSGPSRYLASHYDVNVWPVTVRLIVIKRYASATKLVANQLTTPIQGSIAKQNYGTMIVSCRSNVSHAGRTIIGSTPRVFVVRARGR